MSYAIATKVFGYAGLCASTGLNLSPITVFREVIRKNDVEQFSPFVYIASFTECVLWSFYAIVNPTMFESLINTIIGGFLHFIYLCLFFAYSRGKTRREFCYKLTFAILLLVLAIVMTLCVAPHMPFLERLDSKVSRSANFIGIISVLYSLTTYGSPLSVTGIVLKTRSSHYLPFWITLFTFVSASLWTVYGYFIKNVYFLIPCGGGAVLGLSQILLYFVFRERKRGNHADHATSGNVPVGPVVLGAEGEGEKPLQQFFVSPRYHRVIEVPEQHRRGGKQQQQKQHELAIPQAGFFAIPKGAYQSDNTNTNTNANTIVTNIKDKNHESSMLDGSSTLSNSGRNNTSNTTTTNDTNSTRSIRSHGENHNHHSRNNSFAAARFAADEGGGGQEQHQQQQLQGVVEIYPTETFVESIHVP